MQNLVVSPQEIAWAREALGDGAAEELMAAASGRAFGDPGAASRRFTYLIQQARLYGGRQLLASDPDALNTTLGKLNELQTQITQTTQRGAPIPLNLMAEYENARAHLDAIRAFNERIADALTEGRGAELTRLLADEMRRQQVVGSVHHMRRIYEDLDRQLPKLAWHEEQMIGPGVTRTVAKGLAGSLLGTLGEEQLSREQAPWAGTYLSRVADRYPDVAAWFKQVGEENAVRLHSSMTQALNEIEQPGGFLETTVSGAAALALDAPMYMVLGGLVPGAAALTEARTAARAAKLAAATRYVAHEAGVFALADALRGAVHAEMHGKRLGEVLAEAGRAAGHGAVAGAALGAVRVSPIGRMLHSVEQALGKYGLSGRLTYSALSAPVEAAAMAVAAKATDPDRSFTQELASNAALLFVLGAGNAIVGSALSPRIPARRVSVDVLDALDARVRAQLRAELFDSLPPEARKRAAAGELDIDSLIPDTVIGARVRELVRAAAPNMPLTEGMTLMAATRRALLGRATGLDLSELGTNVALLEAMGFTVDTSTGYVQLDLTNPEASTRFSLVHEELSRFLVERYGPEVLQDVSAVDTLLTPSDTKRLVEHLAASIGEEKKIAEAARLSIDLEKLGAEGELTLGWSSSPVIDAMAEELAAIRSGSTRHVPEDVLAQIKDLRDAVNKRYRAQRKQADAVLTAATAARMRLEDRANNPDLDENERVRAEVDLQTLERVWDLLVQGKVDRAREEAGKLVGTEGKIMQSLASEWHNVVEYALRAVALSRVTEAAGIALRQARSRSEERIGQRGPDVVRAVDALLAGADPADREAARNLVQWMVEADNARNLPQPAEDVSLDEHVAMIAKRAKIELSDSALQAVTTALRNLHVWIGRWPTARQLPISTTLGEQVQAAYDSFLASLRELEATRRGASAQDLRAAESRMRVAARRLAAEATKAYVDRAIPYILSSITLPSDTRRQTTMLKRLVKRLAANLLRRSASRDLLQWLPHDDPLRIALERLNYSDPAIRDLVERVASDEEYVYGLLLKAQEHQKRMAITYGPKWREVVNEAANTAVTWLESAIVSQAPLTSEVRNTMRSLRTEITQLASVPPDQLTPTQRARLQRLRDQYEALLVKRRASSSRLNKLLNTRLGKWLSQAVSAWTEASRTVLSPVKEDTPGVPATEPKPEVEAEDVLIVREEPPPAPARVQDTAPRLSGDIEREAGKVADWIRESERKSVTNVDKSPAEQAADVQAMLESADVPAPDNAVITDRQVWNAVDRLTRRPDFPRRVVTIGVVASPVSDARGGPASAAHTAKEIMRAIHTLHAKGARVKLLVYLPADTLNKRTEQLGKQASAAEYLRDMILDDPNMHPYVDYVIISDMVDNVRGGDPRKVAIGALVGNSHMLMALGDTRAHHVGMALGFGSKDLQKAARRYTNLPGVGEGKGSQYRMMTESRELREGVARELDTATLRHIARAHKLADAGELLRYLDTLRQKMTDIPADRFEGVVDVKPEPEPAPEPPAPERKAPEKPAKPAKPAKPEKPKVEEPDVKIEDGEIDLGELFEDMLGSEEDTPPESGGPC